MDKVSNHIQETFTIQASPGQPAPILTESTTGNEYIMPRIEAIHAGRTKNFNHYLAEKLKGDYEKNQEYILGHILIINPSFITMTQIQKQRVG